MSMEKTGWALDQICRTPLEKLLLIDLADRMGHQSRRRLFIGRTAVWCCSSAKEITAALYSLHASNLLIVHEADHFTADVQWVGPCEADKPVPREPRAPLTKIKQTRQELYAEQGGACWYCGCKLATAEDYQQVWDDELGEHSHLLMLSSEVAEPHIDHVMPRSRGGSNDRSNLVLACATCNISKKNRTVEEYRASLSKRRGGEVVVFHAETKTSKPKAGNQ